MSTNTHVNDLKINKLKEAQFDAAVLSGVIDETQLSIITDAGLSYNELEDLPQPVQVTSLPTASASEVGNIYQFTGTTGTYTNGYFYKCVSDGAVTPTYSWVQVSVQPEGDPLPSQTGNSGKFLTTNGSSTSWATVDALPAQSGQSGKFLTTNGTDASWSDKPIVNNSTTAGGIAIGNKASATGLASLSIGSNSEDPSGNGPVASGENSIAIGGNSYGSPLTNHYGAKASGAHSIAIGSGTMVEAIKSRSIAIGTGNTTANGAGSVIIGGTYNSTNKDGVIVLASNTVQSSQAYSEANTFHIRNAVGAYKMMDADGTIPEARMADTTNAVSGQVLKLDSNLDAQWTTLSTSDITNDAGYITGINSTDVTTALGYTPYNITNPNGYQANVIESISVNNTAQTITNKNVNITVPTTAADVNALPSSTKYGASLSLSINSTTYVVTAQLKDQDGNNLGTAQTIDLPLESVVVNGEYDSVHKKIVLTLQNGTTIEFSVADLVSGLQSEITSSNKLDADLVDDSTSTNKFVTASDKTTWSGKQDALVSGTNIKTVNGNSLLGSGNVTIDSLPDQTGNSGKFLKTNGTTASWANGLENLSTAEQSVSILGTGSTLGSGCINIGTRSNTRYGGIALGYEASCTGNIGIALSQYSLSAGMGSVAIGYNAKATIDYAIQMGAGTNNTSYTFQVYNYRLMNADGTIPEARLASTSSATAGQALILDSNLDAKWTTIDALPSQTGQSGKFLTTNGTTASWDSVPSGSTVTFVEW